MGVSVISSRKAQHPLEHLGPIWLPLKHHPSPNCKAYHSCPGRKGLKSSPWQASIATVTLNAEKGFCFPLPSLKRSLRECTHSLPLCWDASGENSQHWKSLVHKRQSCMLGLLLPMLCSSNINGHSIKMSSETFTWRIVLPELITIPRRKHIANIHAA